MTMQLAYEQSRNISREDCARVSGPGLRTFRNIADVWQLTRKERISAMGEPPRSTYDRWMRRVRADEDVTLPLDTLLRISAVTGIYKALANLFEDPRQGLEWLRCPHGGTVFHGSSPMAFITDGAHDGVMTVRRYLDTWCAGEMDAGAPEGSFDPVREEDVVFL